MTERESMPCDVLVVGGGPAGLAAAIRLKQINEELEVVVLEKGSEIGAHILSGVVHDPRALNELFPDWKENGAPLNVPVTRDEIYFFTSESKASKMPNAFVPAPMHNEGNYIISLGQLGRWLGEQAESLGVEIYPCFAAQSPIVEDGVVKGIVWARGGQRFASWASDGTMRIWDCERKAESIVIQGEEGERTDSAWSPDERLFAWLSTVADFVKHRMDGKTPNSPLPPRPEWSPS